MLKRYLKTTIKEYIFIIKKNIKKAKLTEEVPCSTMKTTIKARAKVDIDHWFWKMTRDGKNTRTRWESQNPKLLGRDWAG